MCVHVINTRIHMMEDDFVSHISFYLYFQAVIKLSHKDTINSLQNKLIQPNHAYSCLGFGKLFNVLSRIGRQAS